jgi:anti-anti-sigma factor
VQLFSTRVGTTSCVEMSGVLDLATEATLRTHLGTEIDTGARELMLDMSLIRFCDAAMLRVLVVAQARLRAVRGQLRVVDCSDCVARLIGISDLEHLLHTPGP